jgi:V8-like Glu-specific endopeptidase
VFYKAVTLTGTSGATLTQTSNAVTILMAAAGSSLTQGSRASAACGIRDLGQIRAIA